jgi:hypothetical protein
MSSQLWSQAGRPEKVHLGQLDTWSVDDASLRVFSTAKEEDR